MTNVNGIVILEYKDLNKVGQSKDNDDIDQFDISKSLKSFKETDYVFYHANNGEIKILKYKYPIIINMKKIW